MGPNQDGRAGGWRRSPLVGGLAAVIAVVAGASVVSRVACRRGSRGALGESTLTVICPHCGATHTVSADEVGLEEKGLDRDVFEAKARAVPCPRCGKTGGVIAAICPQCGKPFAPPTDPKTLRQFKCPHCGEPPWGR